MEFQEVLDFAAEDPVRGDHWEDLGLTDLMKVVKLHTTFMVHPSSGKYEQEYERLDTFQQQLKLKISEEEGRLKKDEEEKKRKCEHEEQWVPSRRRRATKGYQKKVSFIPKSEALVFPIALVFSSIYLCMLRRHFTCERSNIGSKIEKQSSE